MKKESSFGEKEVFKSVAGIEYDDKKTEKDILTNALLGCGGDKNLAKDEYIKLRSNQLMQKYDQWKKKKKRKAVFIECLIALIVIILVAMFS